MREGREIRDSERMQQRKNRGRAAELFWLAHNVKRAPNKSPQGSTCIARSKT